MTLDEKLEIIQNMQSNRYNLYKIYKSRGNKAQADAEFEAYVDLSCVLDMLTDDDYAAEMAKVYLS